MLQESPTMERLTTIAPLVGLWICGVPINEVQISDDILLLSNPAFKLDSKSKEYFTDEEINQMESAKWAFKHTFCKDPSESLVTAEDRSDEILNRAILSVWITVPTAARFVGVFRYRDSFEGVCSLNRHATTLIPHEKYRTNELKSEDLQDLKRVFKGLSYISDQKYRPMRALHLLMASLHLWYWDLRFAGFTSVIESLFSTDNQELSHKLSERIAFFMEHDFARRESLFRYMKRIYTVRSRILHGDDLPSMDKSESFEILADLELLVQRLLKRILMDDELIQKFSGSQNERARYLESLLFT